MFKIGFKYFKAFGGSTSSGTTLGLLLILAFAPNAQNPLKVFILAGQSNMQGQGIIVPTSSHMEKNGGMGTLDYLVENGPDSLFGALKEENSYIERGDVWVYYDRGTNGLKVGNLTAGMGTSDDRIGPELGFGQILGNHFENRVLLIKTCWGGAALHNQEGNTFYPPSSEGPTGNRYEEMLANIENVLGDIGAHFSDYGGEGYELAGFAWHQGWNDAGSDDNAQAYEQNLVHFINDVRESLEVPHLPFVVGNSGFNGWERGPGFRARLWDYIQPAQLAVGDPAEYPGFEGTVASVETRDFWFEADDSPGSSPSHWNLNAESYFRVGDAMGRAMVNLLGDVPAIPGCMDSVYVEYNPDANQHDSAACITLEVEGKENFPNQFSVVRPNNWELEVRVPYAGAHEISLLDFRGVLHYQRRGSGSAAYLLSLPPQKGLYVIKLSAKDGYLWRKIFKH